MPQPEDVVRICDELRNIERSARDIRRIFQTTQWDNLPPPNCKLGPWIDDGCRPPDNVPSATFLSWLRTLKEAIESVKQEVEELRGITSGPDRVPDR